jgi:hypothetical protein
MVEHMQHEFDAMRRVLAVFLLLLGLAAGSSIFLGSVHAADQVSAGQGLEISPPVIELKAEPGQTVVANIRIRNVTQQEVIARGQVNDFTAGGEEGQPNIKIDGNEVTSHSLRPWVKSVPDLRLAKLELKTVAVAIEVPKNAAPGGHYGVIRFTATPPDIETSGVALSASLGTLVLVDVAGSKVEKASFATFLVEHEGRPGTFFEAGPIGFVQRIKNEGTVHIKPVGTVEVFDMFRRKVATLDVNKDANNILPDSIRRFEQTWQQKFLIGRYEATMNLTYGAGGKTLTKSVVFWVVPWKLILLILVLLTVFIFVIRKALKNYNQRVIEKYRRKG